MSGRERRPVLALLAVVGSLALPLSSSDAAEPRILRKEIVVEAPPAEVWHAWTTVEGAAFVSRASNIELRIGGPYEWFLDVADEEGKRGGAGSKVLAFLPQEMLAFDWTFPPAVPTLRRQGAKTQAVVLLDDLGDGRTRVRFAQHGWGEGEDWDAGWDYFDRAWGYVLERLKATLEGGADEPGTATR